MAEVVILSGFKTKPVTESRLEDMEPESLQK